MVKKVINKYQSLPLQVKASFWFLICTFLQKGISGITTPIFTRLLNPVEFGQYSVFNSWFNIVSAFVGLNLAGGCYMQGIVKFKEYRNEFTSAMQGLSITLVMAWTIIYFLSRNFWNNIFSMSTIQMLAMFSMIWTYLVINFWSAEQRVDFKYRKLVAVTLLISIAKPVTGIILVINSKDKVTARILGLALVELIGYVPFFFIQMKRGKKIFSKKFWKYALLFCIPLIPHYLSMYILSGADRIMISKMVGDNAAGIYSLAYSIALIMALFNNAMNKTIEPWLYKQIRDKNVDNIAKIAYPALIIVAAVNLALIAFAPEILYIFASSDYFDAIWIIPPVTMSVFFMFSYIFFSAFEFYYEKTVFIAAGTAIGAITNVILNYICIKKWGYYAAGYTTLFCYILYSFIHYCFMRRICNEFLNGANVYNIKILLAISIGFLAAGFLLLSTYNNQIIRYAVILICSGILILKRKTVINSVKNILNAKRN